jgi:hypothetical protein
LPAAAVKPPPPPPPAETIIRKYCGTPRGLKKVWPPKDAPPEMKFGPKN